MPGFEINTSEELLNLHETKTIKKGDVIIYRCHSCGRWVLRRARFCLSNDIKPIYYSLLCQKCKTELRFLKTWGTKHPFKDKQFRENMLYKGMERKFGEGIKHPFQNEELKNKAHKTTCKNFNSDHPFSTPEMLNRIKAGNIKKYGVECSLQNPEVKAKSDETMLNMYGVTNIFNSKEFQTDLKNKLRDEYGVENISQIPETREKAKASVIKHNLDTYGVEQYFNSEQHIDFMMSNYGTLHVNHTYLYHGITFHSSWELAVWIYCVDHNIPIVREPVRLELKDINNNLHYYEPDFMINGKLVEIKGKQFFRPDGTMYCPFRKPEWDNRKYNFMNDLYERKHQCGLANGVVFWKDEDIVPYLQYCDLTYPGWQFMYRRDNPWNPSYWVGFMWSTKIGITPFDIDTSQQYAPLIGHGVTPFDTLDYTNSK